jgi:two-component system, cell cycle sensor histidine kinase and response regulator CckA
LIHEPDVEMHGGDKPTESMEALSRLAGGMAHDFNNLLGIIASYAAFASEAILEATQDGDRSRLAAAAADLKEIQLATGRATVRTRQLLAFAGRSAGRLVPVDLNDIVNRAVTEGARGQRRIEVVRRLAVGLPSVIGDPGEYHRAFISLVQNAYEAMPHGGTLEVATSATARGGVAGVELRVSDTGVGMTDDVREHAFEPYFTTKDYGLGAGLGLATVFGIARRAGGAVDIDSTRGAGTTVTMWLPVGRLQLVAPTP